MATEIIRVNSDDHAWIMNWGKETDRSAAAIIAYWVKKQQADMGSVVVQKDHIRSRKIYSRPYDITLDRLRKIPTRVPTPKQVDEKKAIDAGLLKIPFEPALLQNLSYGVTDSEIPKRRQYWVKCTHLLTWVIGRVAGLMGDEIRSDSLALLTSISDYRIEVFEETPSIFIAVNDTAEKMLRILTINCADDAESHGQEKEYFSPEDLWFLWNAGYEIIYKDAVL